MADNTTLPGTGDVIATDDIAGVKYQLVKLAWGALDTVNIVDTASGKPVPMQLRSPTGVDLTGPAGTASAAVLSVQGIASGTPILVAQNGTWTVQQGTTPSATPWLFKIGDGTNNVSIKAASTAASATDPALVVTLSPNTPAQAMAGDVAAGSTDSGAPVKQGGVARTSNPTAVSNGQRVNASFDKLGKQIAVGAIREMKGVQKTSIATTAETTIVTAGAAGVFNDVYALVVTNKSPTSVFVDFKDSTGGTTRLTLAAPANDSRGFTVAVDSAMVQSGAAANWTATLSSAASTVEITALYVSNT